MTASGFSGPAAAGRQRGAALVIGLILLLVLTAIAFSIMQVSGMQNKMARNLRDQSIAFQAAEAALRKAEVDIAAGTVSGNPFHFKRFTSTCSTNAGLCLPAAGVTPTVTWTSTSTNTLAVPSTDFTVPAGVDQPRYIIELISGKPVNDASVGCSAALFRITAQGFGQNGARASLQSIYRYRVINC
jgi:type IV pilus assembly protein PilX